MLLTSQRHHPCIAPSFNGRTSDSDSLDRGSNPWGATKIMETRLRGAFFFARFCASSDVLRPQ
jgi:hypothetical protein